VPAVFEQLVPVDRSVAPVQLSFTGGGGSVTQILKVPVAFVLEYTLIQYTVPTVRPVGVTEALPQERAARPPQPPENTVNRGLVIPVKTVRVMVGSVVCAVNLYHTSFLLPVPQASGEIVVYVVAPVMAPAVFVQTADEVSVTAPEHRSFAWPYDCLPAKKTNSKTSNNFNLKKIEDRYDFIKFGFGVIKF